MGTPYIDERWVKDHGLHGQPVTPKPNLRWYHCRSRTLLAMGAFVAVIVGLALAREWRQERVVADFESLGATVWFKGSRFCFVGVRGAVPTFLKEASDDLRRLSSSTVLCRFADASSFIKGTY